jgi:carboxymethylenebutenolidase
MNKRILYFEKRYYMSNNVTLTVKDAAPMNAYVALPEGSGPFPAVIVFQEAFGINSYMREVADRIAKQGYVAIAPELFHRTAPAGFEASYNDFSKVMEHFQAITTEGLEADIQAAYDWLQSSDKVQKDNIGSIGFCLGGRVSFIANTFLPLKAAVSFYGGGTHALAGRADKMSGAQLFFWGGKDQHIKPEHVQEVIDAVKNAGKEYINVEISYADHGFLNYERPAYNADAAHEAWGMVDEFFKNKFGLNK